MLEDNLRAKEDVEYFSTQMEELDNETEVNKNKVIEIDTEKTNTISTKYILNLRESKGYDSLSGYVQKCREDLFSKKCGRTNSISACYHYQRFSPQSRRKPN